MKKIIVYLFVLTTLFLMPLASAKLVLNDLYFDPAIIASGDEVDIVIQFSHDITTLEESKVSDPDYTFGVSLEPDDTLSEQFITIQDAIGDDLYGRILAGGLYNKRFRVKVAQNAPSGNYQLMIKGQWYYKGQPESGYLYERFLMPVKREGIVLGWSSFETNPAEVRPGDEFVEIIAKISNTGQKDAKSVNMQLAAIQGIEASYTNNNLRYIGYLKSGESAQVQFFVDIDEYLTSGVHVLPFTMEYQDIDDNGYTKQGSIDFLVKSRPYLEVVSSYGKAAVGTSGVLQINITNKGEESAESVDVRILKQSSQPFAMDIRSDYLGEIMPGETRTAQFMLEVQPQAIEREYSLELQIRALGDRDTGDDNVYTYSRRAQFVVEGKQQNYLFYIGGISVIALVLYFMVRRKK